MFFKNVTNVILIMLLFAVLSATAQQLPDSVVVVTANASPVPFENLSRTVVIFERKDIDALPIRTIADVLHQVASIDLRSRAPYGMQSDISIRGSAYSQVLVLVDGMRINDSQTGHHNSDFPVQLQNVERIEVLLGAGSSLYGADALGGTVNIITGHPAERVTGSLAFGQYGLVDGSFATYFEKGSLKQSVSVSGSRSSGFQYDRDFSNTAVSSRVTLRDKSVFYISYVDKEFGANGFYGPAPSREWTNQTFVSAERKFEGSSGNRSVMKGFYRSHGDRFLYDVRTPDLYENRHRTHAAGGQWKGIYGVSRTGVLTLGGELGGDWIVSSNLGDHSLTKVSIFSEFQWTPDSSDMPGPSSSSNAPAALYPGLRFDYYSNYGVSVSPSLSGSWWLLPRLRLRSSIGHAFRIPTFTELYYRDPNHRANSDLKAESAWSADAGVEYLPSIDWMGSLTVFSRREKDVIDWVRNSEDEPWRTFNIRKLRTVGFEASIKRSFGPDAGLGGTYTYISTDAGSVDYLSKYVLDFARHSFSTSLFISFPLGIGYKQTAQYHGRSDGRSYWLLDGCLEKTLPGFVARLDFTNLLDSEYQEIRGVDMPGRWFALSVRID